MGVATLVTSMEICSSATTSLFYYILQLVQRLLLSLYAYRAAQCQSMDVSLLHSGNGRKPFGD